MNADAGAGARIARLRKLAGWTQPQLAARIFVSTSLVKKVEQGRTPPSPAFVTSCAAALGVEVRELYGVRVADNISEFHSESAGISELREALQCFDDPQPAEPALRPDHIRAHLNRAESFRRGQKYADLALILPQVLHHLFVQVAETSPTTWQGEQNRGMLHDAYRLAATVGGRFGHPDIAATASERHVTLAPATGDPLRSAVSDWHRSTHFLQNGHYAGGLRLLNRALQHVEDQPGSHAAHGVAAQLQLRAAVLAARNDDAERADDHIREARTRVSLGASPSPYYNTDASELNVLIHWCAVPVERYDGTEAVARASRITVADPTRPERVGHHHIDQARAWMLHGDRERALAELNLARRFSPHHTRTHPSVRETVRALATADRRATTSLAGFARWAGIQM
ncbi:helix-turn-helix domain-containing protein [Saccharopolyspora phatthalungensis]|uniref:Transcriptional regulator with XRE-family HTH domain n=1 Tax=Saccharopolyspora phatthalungensis TaxID=664693 RepID=A0A840QIL5_9PSEU|nr:helix-turn-helix transcriptional regulator [Saccharopolyspora phatthalungensis]MBB5159990.1 transcriptional regulator with XRE-family HTH domain [Saccharopolyspora phatthalungensis]